MGMLHDSIASHFWTSRSFVRLVGGLLAEYGSGGKFRQFIARSRMMARQARRCSDVICTRSEQSRSIMADSDVRRREGVPLVRITWSVSSF